MRSDKRDVAAAGDLSHGALPPFSFFRGTFLDCALLDGRGAFGAWLLRGGTPERSAFLHGGLGFERGFLLYRGLGSDFFRGRLFGGSRAGRHFGSSFARGRRRFLERDPALGGGLDCRLGDGLYRNAFRGGFGWSGFRARLRRGLGRRAFCDRKFGRGGFGGHRFGGGGALRRGEFGYDRFRRSLHRRDGFGGSFSERALRAGRGTLRS